MPSTHGFHAQPMQHCAVVAHHVCANGTAGQRTDSGSFCCIVCRQIFESMLFLFVEHAFDVGDLLEVELITYRWVMFHAVQCFLMPFDAFFSAFSCFVPFLVGSVALVRQKWLWMCILWVQGLAADPRQQQAAVW